MTNRTILVGLFSLIAVGISSAASPANEQILIKTTRLIDMSKGSISYDQAILINGATIVEIGPGSVVQHATGNVRVVDLTGLTVLPGLIDCHVHVLGNLKDLSSVAQLRTSSGQATLWGAHNLQIWPDHGFTTLRDAGEQDLGYGQLALRDSIKMGLIKGPRMKVKLHRSILSNHDPPPDSLFRDLYHTNPVWAGLFNIGHRFTSVSNRPVSQPQGPQAVWLSF